MGFLIGAVIGCGLFLAIQAWREPRPIRVSDRASRRVREVFLPGIGAFLLVALVSLAITASLPMSAVLGALGSLGPTLWRERRRQRRIEELRDAWPEALDHVVGALRSGMSVAEALSTLATRGPEILRSDFQTFADSVRSNGRVVRAIDELKESLADPMADRILEAMRIAHELGGRDLAKTMAQLASLVREDNRARGELLARQSWTVNGARIATAAPWVMLLLFSTRPSTLEAYSTPAGIAVLVGGAALSALAYALMIRLGKLPDDSRIFARREVAHV